jgi:hypothetical protein
LKAETKAEKVAGEREFVKGTLPKDFTVSLPEWRGVIKKPLESFRNL